MNSHMGFKVSFFIESFLAFFNRADELFLTNMFLQMLVQVKLLCVAFVTALESTLESLFILVSGFGGTTQELLEEP